MWQFLFGCFLLGLSTVGAFLGQKLVAENWNFWKKIELPIEDTSNARVHEPVWMPHVETEKFSSQQWIEPIQLQTAGTVEAQHIRLVEKETGKHQADFVIVRLYEGSYWLPKKSDKLYQGDRRPLNLDERITTEKFAELVSKSEKVLGIGLSSNIGEREENEQLAFLRAKKICAWLEKSGKLGTAACVPAPLGQALSKADSGTDKEVNQRSALIIGIKRQNPLISWDSLYNELLLRTNVNDIDLNDYSATKSLSIEQE